MKTTTLIWVSALLLAAISTSQANLVTCTFTGAVTSTNGILHAGVQIGDTVSGSFGYESSLLTHGGSVLPSDLSAYLQFAVLGTGIGVAANNGVSPGYLTMVIGPDGLPVSSSVFNGLYAGGVSFDGGIGSGFIYNDAGPSGNIGFSITGYALATPEASSTFVLMAVAMSGLLFCGRLARKKLV